MRNAFQPEGRQAEYVTHRTDYEGAGGKEVFQWLPGISPDSVRLGKKGGPGSPRRRFGYFAAEGKVTRAGARKIPKQPEVLNQETFRGPLL